MFPQGDAGSFMSAQDGCASVNSGAPSVITAGGALDNVKVTGQSINRKTATGALAHTAVIATGYVAALTDTKTLSFAHEYEDSADSSSWNTAVDIETATVYETSSGGGNERGVAEFNLSLTALLQYLRVNVTADLNAANTDTVEFFTVVMLAGWTQVPQ